MSSSIYSISSACPVAVPRRGVFACAWDRGTALTHQILASQVLIALCAPALAFESSRLANVPAGPIRFYVFLFLATLTSYRLHAHVARFMSKSPARHEHWRCALTVGSALAGGVLAMGMSGASLVLTGIAAVLAWFYSVPLRSGGCRLREFGITKIIVLTGVWTLMTAVLPLLGQTDAFTFVLLACRRFLFVFALCMAFDVRDLDADANRNIRTLPVRMGPQRSYGAIRLALAAFAGLSLLVPVGEPPRIRPGMTAALVLSALLTWMTVEAARRRPSPLLYLGGIDGMMLIQSLLVAAACVLIPT